MERSKNYIAKKITGHLSRCPFYCVKRNIETKKTKWIECVDCGEWIEVGEQATTICRCETCQIINDKKRKREWKAKNKK